MASQTDIANLALTHIAQTAITSIDDTNDPAARICKLMWPHALDRVLTDHSWNFAIARAELTQTTAPAFGFEYAFNLPTDFLRVLTVNNDTLTDDQATWVIEGQTLLSMWETAQITYVTRAEVTGEYSPEFIDAISHYLAYLIAHRITGSVTIRGHMHDSYMKCLSATRTIDANANRPPVRHDYARSQLVRERRSSSLG